MRISIKLLIVVLVLFIINPAFGAQKKLTDPYEIIQKSFQAMGIAEMLPSQQDQYFEGSIVIEGTGLSGTVKNWQQLPNRSRQEMDLKIIKQIEGYNGQVAWTQDANGKVDILKDENALKRKKIEALMDDAKNFKPGSPYFKLTLNGIEKVGAAECYAILITNTINPDKQIKYIDTSSFLIDKTAMIQPDSQQNITLSDYRDINGVKCAFKMEIEALPIGQKMTIKAEKYEIGVSIDSSIFEIPTQDARDFQFTNGDRSENIPFKYIENHLFLPVTINGQEKVWCLDSGAEMSVIDPTYLAELGLSSEGNMKGIGAGKTVDVSFVNLPPYQVAGIRFKQQKIASIEIRKLFKQYMDLDVPGILGYDFLSRFIAKVDFSNERISFYDPDTFVYKGEGQVLAAPLKDKLFTVPMSVDGKYSGMWSLDLGAGGTDFHYPFAQENGFLKLSGVINVGAGAGGNFTTKSTRFRELEFAGFIIPKPILSFPNENVEGAFRVKELIGNMGNDILKHFVLYLDYKRQQVIIEKGKDFDRVFPVDKSGLSIIQSNEDGLIVYHISENTPAAKAGFKINDIITAINGKSVAEWGRLRGVRELLKEKAGTIYTITIRRETKEKKLTLTLKDLI